MQCHTFSLRGNDKNTLSVYLLDRAVDGQKRPVFISCPGGGWLDCSPNEGNPVAMAFMRQEARVRRRPHRPLAATCRRVA